MAQKPFTFCGGPISVDTLVNLLSFGFFAQEVHGLPSFYDVFKIVKYSVSQP